MLRYLGQKMLQVFVELQLVRLGRLRHAVDNCTGLDTVDGINEVLVGAANGEGPYRTLRCKVIDVDFSVVQEHFQLFLLVQTIFQAIPRLLTQNRSRRLLPRTFIHQAQIPLGATDDSVVHGNPV